MDWVSYLFPSDEGQQIQAINYTLELRKPTGEKETSRTELESMVVVKLLNVFGFLEPTTCPSL